MTKWYVYVFGSQIHKIMPTNLQRVQRHLIKGDALSKEQPRIHVVCHVLLCNNSDLSMKSIFTSMIWRVWACLLGYSFTFSDHTGYALEETNCHADCRMIRRLEIIDVKSLSCALQKLASPENRRYD